MLALPLPDYEFPPQGSAFLFALSFEDGFYLFQSLCLFFAIVLQSVKRFCHLGVRFVPILPLPSGLVILGAVVL